MRADYQVTDITKVIISFWM